jgi:zinc transport system substrate-binding protein
LKTLVISFIALLLTNCSFKSAVKPATSKPTVLVSLAPYKKMIEQIAGDKVTCIPVVPAGVDPHHFEPTLQKMHSLLNANIWFAIGEDFESKIYPVLKQKNPNLQAISLLDIFSTLDRLKLSISGSLTPLYYADHNHSHDASHSHASDKDTHIWLSPKLDIAQVKLITYYLKKLLPKDVSFLENNSKNLIKQLEAIQNTLTKELAPFKNTAIITNHEAFGYFCRDFSLQQIPVIASDFKELGAQDLSKVFERLKKTDVRAAILQPQHPQKALTMIAGQNHYPIDVIDPYAENYLETLNLLAKAVIRP